MRGENRLSCMYKFISLEYTISKWYMKTMHILGLDINNRQRIETAIV